MAKINIMCPDCGTKFCVGHLDWEVLGCLSCRHLVPLREWFIPIGKAHLTKRRADSLKAGVFSPKKIRKLKKVLLA